MSKLLEQAIIWHQNGELTTADKAYQELLAESAQNFDAWHLSGVLRHQTGQHQAAIERINRALQLNPQSAEAWFHLGSAYVEVADAANAKAAFHKALEIQPSLLNAWNALGNLHQASGQFEAAQQAYQKLLELEPRYADGHYNLGHLYGAFGRTKQAISSVKVACELDPQRVDFYGFLGTLYEDAGDPDKAMESYRSGLMIAPSHADLHYHCGFIYESRNQLLEAQNSYEQAVSSNPKHGGALSALLFLKRKLCDWQQLPELHQRAAQVINSGQADITPFSWLLEPSSASEQRACAHIWTRQLLSRIALTRKQKQYLHKPKTRQKITVGYLSADYYDHPTAFLAAGLFEAHDCEKFTVIGYSNSPDANSAMRTRLERSFDEFVDINALSYREAADRIVADGVDILVDLKGYTLDAASEVMALRPAPIQVNYLGYPGTMAADFIDYIIGDRDVTPFEWRDNFSESIVQMPDSYQVNDSHRERHQDTPSKASLGLPENGFVFGCLNTSFKLTPEMFGCWMRILKAVPESSLLLFAKGQSSPVATNLKRYAKQLDVDPARLVFVPGKPYAEYLAQFRQIDLFLDTRPYNAHTTASDALWEGCPVLTITGKTFASKVGASLLRAAGFAPDELADLVCSDVQEFEQAAIGLATDGAKLKKFREHLERNRDSVPLFDTQRFTYHLEQAYQTMLQRYAQGKAPKEFAVGVKPD